MIFFQVTKLQKMQVMENTAFSPREPEALPLGSLSLESNGESQSYQNSLYILVWYHVEFYSELGGIQMGFCVT